MLARVDTGNGWENENGLSVAGGGRFVSDYSGGGGEGSSGCLIGLRGGGFRSSGYDVSDFVIMSNAVAICY